MTKWITILLALVGLGIALYTVATNGSDKAPSPLPATPPSVNPYGDGIAAAGSVEALSRNIGVSAPEGAVVVDVFVEVGQSVKKGEPLFALDTRLLQAELRRARAAKVVAESELVLLRSQPRAEEVPALTASLDAAKVQEADARDMLNDMQDANRRSAMSPSEMSRRRFAVELAVAEVARAQAQLNLLRAGAWLPLVNVASARLAAAEADIEAISIRIDRLTVRSPLDGLVLKRNVEPGQFAGGVGGVSGMGGAAGSGSGGSGGAAAMVVGDVSRLRVRARVDEEDAPLLRADAKATARVRGVAPEMLELKMVRIEPLAQPKMDLMGSTVERVDTRVVEVVFDVVGTPTSPVFPGQAVDVFIDVAKVGVR
ncbi:MAG: HlyD family secretion protein [Phycisphaerales bacterium]